MDVEILSNQFSAAEKITYRALADKLSKKKNMTVEIFFDLASLHTIGFRKLHKLDKIRMFVKEFRAASQRPVMTNEQGEEEILDDGTVKSKRKSHTESWELHQFREAFNMFYKHLEHEDGMFGAFVFQRAHANNRRAIRPQNG